MNYDEVEKLAERYYRYMFSLIPQVIKLMSVSKEKLKRQIVLENPETITSSEVKNRNVILTLGHYGNWEILNVLPEFIDHKTYALYSKISDSVVDRIMMHTRTRFGVEMLEMSKAPRFILKNKDSSPAMYYFISDQSAPPSSKTYKFMNQDSYVYQGIDFFAKKLNAVVVYAEITPNGSNYKIKFTPIDHSEDITADYLKLLQTSIENAPEYWLWSHKRWKHITADR